MRETSVGRRKIFPQILDLAVFIAHILQRNKQKIPVDFFEKIERIFVYG